MQSRKQCRFDILPDQLTFEGGGAWDEMKNHANRIRQYETEKDKLKSTCTSWEEYEREVRRLAVRYRV